ncbi:MAG: hypothetical protein HF982_01095 [Desulfobacteraceae bacterium]|nr:hypothetical protein [Desulfobacteraceae bacterium]MBC2718195.1 hypothetical protein [Desulfobacteraceae bacterium]
MKENILVLVRATPEKSNRHGHLVCVAGINEDNNLRRLYPFEFRHGENLIDFRKRDMIEVALTEPDNDKRPESRKVVTHTNLNSRLNDEDVRTRILPLVTSIEKLNETSASLGIIKPELQDVKIQINTTKISDEQTYFSMAGDFLETHEKVKIPVELRYQFKCKNEPECKGHNIILIDWELNELARNVMRNDKDSGIVKEKIRAKFFDFMKTRDLYFFMGTHFRFGTWIIIGIFYPSLPKNTISDSTVQTTLLGV